MTDILLDQQGGHWVVVDAAALKLAGSDLLLDSPGRRGNAGQFRRALVHNERDGLTINFNRDYPGGVTIEDARIRLRVNSGAKLPKEGRIGELYLMETNTAVNNVIVGLSSTSLWLCVSSDSYVGTATWREIPLGESRLGEV